MATVDFQKSNIPDVDPDKVNYEEKDPVKEIQEQNFNIRGAMKTAVGFYKGSPLIVQIMVNPFNFENAYEVHAKLSDGDAGTYFPNEEPALRMFDYMIKKYNLTEAKRPK